MKKNTAPARGMRDLLPDQVERRDDATRVILEAYERFGFRRVETPALEHIALLSSGEGGDNEKLIYKVLKRGDKLDLSAAQSADDLVDFGLRYDLTVPLARFYAEHAAELPAPFRSIQIGPVWRAERPQKGRYRQFTQCDIDILGEASVLAEIELIRATVRALNALGLKGLRVRVNDRRMLTAFVEGCGFDAERSGEVFITIDKLDKIGVDGVRKELLGKGHPDAAIERATAMLQCVADGKAAEAVDAYRAACTGAGNDADTNPAGVIEAELMQLMDVATSSLPDGVAVEIDPTLVRGMGYYTGVIFEVSMEGYPFSMAGGGRYDRMIGSISGKDVPACGFSIGFERVLMVLEDLGIAPQRRWKKVALLYGPETDYGELMAHATQLRERGADGETCSVTTLASRKKLGRQLDELQAQGFDSYAVCQAGQAPVLKTFRTS